MICPRCGSEYRPGFTECAECHVQLVEASGEAAASDAPASDSRSPSDEWTVLVEHMMEWSWICLDGTCVAMLGLESELTAQGIDVVFDPFRPGDGSSYTRSIMQPVRMMVKASEFDRAHEVAESLDLGDALVERHCPT